jgi:hypothetical protein
MDFHALLDKLNRIEGSTVESNTAENCGSPMPPMPAQTTPTEPPPPPPSMSVNLNAQGIDNIEQMMKLFQKVNPDMMPKVDPMPIVSPPPSIMSIKPEIPPLKMLPDFDADNDDKVGGEKDIIMKMGAYNDHNEPDGDEVEIKGLDRDDEDDKKNEWANEPEPENKDIDYMVNKLAGGMNKGHETYPKVSDGDNPMWKVNIEGADLKAQIRAELLKRLAEAKGAK